MCVYSRDLFNQEDKSRFPFLGNQVYCLYNSLPKDFKNRTTLKVFKDYVNDWKSKITPFSFNKIKNLINSLFEEKEIPIEIKNLLENLDNIINNYGLVKVESVEMGEKEPTFDFYMPETSSFILEGVITHNTTLTLHAIAEAQKLKMQAGFIDMEHAFNADYAETIGVNVEELFFTQPDYGEEALNILIDMVKSHLFGLIVVDSVASLVPKSELEGEVGEAKMGVQARMMGQAMRKVVALAEKANCTIIFINQTREKIGVMFGDPTTTSGGNALKFACSQRLHITQSSKLKNGEDIYGNTVRVNVIKNKIGKPFKKTQFNLIYGKGIDKLAEIIDLAVETEVMKKAGAGWYSYGETKLCQGNDKLVALLEDNPELLEEIKTKTMAKL
jgi:recombination protein RecA